VAILALFATVEARAATLTIYQVSGRQFTDLNGGSPSDGTLSWEFPGSALLAQNISTGTVRRFAFEFPLSGIPTNAVVLSAFFSAAEQTDAGGGSVIYARPGNGTVDLGDLFDFSNLVGGSSSGAGNGIVGPVNLDLTAYVQSLVTANAGYLALSFSPLPSIPDAAYSIQNFDNAGPQIDPRLVVTFEVPEPSSLVLASLGLVGLLNGCRRRRHHGHAKLLTQLSSRSPSGDR
jgi:hypothetical protein